MPQASAEIHRVPMNVLRPALDSSRFSCSFSFLLSQGPLGPKYIFDFFYNKSRASVIALSVIQQKNPALGQARPVTKLVPEKRAEKLKAHINAKKEKTTRESAGYP